MDVLILVVLVLVGILAGAASGMFGIGGGIVIVPALTLLAPLGFRDAVAASLLFITLTSPLGIWRHAKARRVDFKTGALLGATGLLGILLAEVVARQVTDQVLIFGFALVLTAAARNIAYGRLPQRRIESRLLIAGVGVAGGFVAKLFGIGGGIVMVPAMALAGFDIHVAVGTSLLVVLVNGLVSTGINLTQGHSWVLWSLPVAVGGYAGTLIGSWQSLRTQGAPLRRWFALLMVLVALDLVRSTL